MKTVRLKGSDYSKFMKNVDGYRDSTKKSLFDAYGPVRIAGPSGRFIAVVHSDPGEGAVIDVAPEQQAPAEVDEGTMMKQAQSMKRLVNSGNAQQTPNPRSCKCASWPLVEGEEIEKDERGRPVTHRRACAYRKRWEQKSFHHKTQTPTGVLAPRIHPTTKPVNSSVPKPSRIGRNNPTMKVKTKLDKIPSPANCPECGSWTQTKKHQAQYPNQHHPICKHFKKYLTLSTMQKAAGIPQAPPVKTKVERQAFLFNLKTQEQVREAEAEEIVEARRRLRDEGAALCSVGDEEYFVMYGDGEQVEPLEAEPEEASDTEPPPADEPSDDEPADEAASQEEASP